ncbi:DUF4118 domain-containing protein [Kribbella sp. CA-294648]|uniref:DUF4118 domain-containing protein n=1 Tax=Kribbella sp. CA-294648 TaxID=3239948 RepID=UPI003D8BD76B
MNLTEGVARHRTAVITAAVATPLATCALLAAFHDELSIATEVLVVVLVVVAAASTGIRVAGLAAAVSGGVWFDFFLTQPYHPRDAC